MKERPKKVLILNPNIPPRAIKYLNILATGTAYNYHVFFYSVSAKNRRWKLEKTNIRFKYKILKSFDIGFGAKDYFPFSVSLDYLFELWKLRPEVIIIPGWSDMPSYFSAFYCKLTGSKLILRSESTRYETSLRRKILMPFTKLMVKMADAYLASGTRSARYLVNLGASKSKIFIGYSTVDIDYFASQSAIERLEKLSMKEALGIPINSRVIMFSGQLIIRKGVYDLLESFFSLSSSYDNVYLLIVGYGPEYSNMKRVIGKRKLENKVVFTGFIPNETLPKYYAISDIFVLPSHEETWGVVVNEAMACRCAVIVGNKVGSSEDLVQSGVTGLIFKSGDVSSLTQAIKLLLIKERLRLKLAENAALKIKAFNFENLKRKMVDSINFVLSNNY